MRLQMFVYLVVVIGLIGAAVMTVVFKQTSLPLWALEEVIERGYAVPSRSVFEVAHLLRSAGAERVLLLDAREIDEYKVSHLAGAQHLAPNILPEEFLQRYGAALRGKRVIIYCSVGKRSSDAAARLSQAAQKAGAVECANMRGGIFRWYTEQFELVDTSGQATRALHKFDRFWGMFVPERP